MIFTLILGLLIALLAVIFAIQNPDIATVSFFSLEFSQPLAIILLIAFGLGIIMLALVSTPGFIKRRATIASQKKEMGRLEKKIESLMLEVTESKVAVEKIQASLYESKQALAEAEAEVKKAREEARLTSASMPPAGIAPSGKPEEAPVINEPDSSENKPVPPDNKPKTEIRDTIYKIKPKEE